MARQFLFPGVGGATGAASAATGAIDANKASIVLITVTQNTWVVIGPAGATAAANTGLLVTPNVAVEAVVPAGYVIAYIEDSTAGKISVVRVSG